MKMLRSRPNRLGQVFRFRRRHDENNFVGRFFKSLEKRVRGLVRKHVRFVEDYNFVASAGRSVANHFAQFANLVDAAI